MQVFGTGGALRSQNLYREDTIELGVARGTSSPCCGLQRNEDFKRTEFADRHEMPWWREL